MDKSTLLREVAAAHNTDVVDLDDLATRDAVVADPALFVVGSSPACIERVSSVVSRCPLPAAARRLATAGSTTTRAGRCGTLLRLTPEKLSRKDPTGLTELGHLLETFVVGELMRVLDRRRGGRGALAYSRW